MPFPASFLRNGLHVEQLLLLMTSRFGTRARSTSIRYPRRMALDTCRGHLATRWAPAPWRPQSRPRLPLTSRGTTRALAHQAGSGCCSGSPPSFCEHLRRQLDASCEDSPDVACKRRRRSGGPAVSGEEKLLIKTGSSSWRWKMDAGLLGLLQVGCADS